MGTSLVWLINRVLIRVHEQPIIHLRYFFMMGIDLFVKSNVPHFDGQNMHYIVHQQNFFQDVFIQKF